MQDDPAKAPLTRRQSEVGALVAQGLASRAIALRLGISERTVEGHVLNLMNLLGATSRAEVAAWWVRRTMAMTTDDVPASNLPLALTTFVGRERQMTELRELFRDHRLISLLGPGGCGKTRLALRVASSLRAAHPDGVWLVELGEIADPLLVPQALADVLRLKESPVGAVDEPLLEHLAKKRLLLLLDNAEHLLEAAAQISHTILSRCPGVRLLVTSREPLRVPGELKYRIPMLSYPDPRAPIDLSGASGHDAVQLFMDRARDQNCALRLADSDASTVVRICAHLDGIPLAIELAAAWAQVMTLEDILAGLVDRFGFLTMGESTAPLRQRTLATAIDWSYELLDSDERRLFCRIGIFAGEFTMSDLEAVCLREGDDRGQLLHLISRLATKSLVIMGGGRIRMLETIREYSRRRMAEHDRPFELATGHAIHFARIAAEKRSCEGSNDWRQCLDRCLPDLRAAFTWALNNDPHLILRAAGPLREYWLLRGHVAEARQALEALAAAILEPPAARVQALTLAAAVAYHQDDLEAGVRWLDEAMLMGRTLPPGGLGGTLQVRGYLDLARNDLTGAVRTFEEAVNAARENGRPANEVAGTLHDLGVATAISGRLEDARNLFEESVRRRSESTCPDEGHLTLAFLALALLLMGNIDQARETVRKALEAAGRLGDHRAAWGVQVAACIAAASGDAQQAIVLDEAGAAMHESAGAAPMLKAWTAMRRRWMEPAATALSAAEADAMRARGRELTFHEALAGALEMEARVQVPDGTRR